MPSWWPSWRGEPCVIVASGPSAGGVDVEKARGKAHVLVVNNGWKLAAWADALFAIDYAWWKHWQGCPQFAGAKLSTDHRACREWDLQRIGLNRWDARLELAKLGTVGDLRNSGGGCLNLAVQFGCDPILLVGFDMRVDHGLHFDGAHPPGMNNPRDNSIATWRRNIDAAARQIQQLGLRVINCSPVSALRNYPVLPFDDALREFA
jgi:hypothetical protein